MSRFFTIRLTAILLTVGLLLLAVCVGTAFYVQEMHRNISSILTLNVASMRAAEELEISLREIRNHLDSYLLGQQGNQLQRLPRLRQETAHWLTEAEKAATTEREQQLMIRVRRGHEHFFHELDQLIQHPQQRPDHASIHRLMDQVLNEEILRPAHEYLNLNEDMALQTAARNEQAVGWTVLSLILVGICGPIAGLLAGWVMAHRLNRALVRLSLPIHDATGLLGEVVEPITLKPGWGLEELETVLQRMAQQISEVIERMHRSQQEALRAEQLAMLGQLAAGLAHELRNPLMSMKLLVQASVARGTGGLAGRDLAVLEEEISRLERLTSSLLDYARPPLLEKSAFEINVLLDDTIELLSGRAGRRDIVLHCFLPDEPIWLEADSGQIRQVVLNLLLNALEAVADGGQVSIHLRVLQQDVIEIEIQDTGPGLPTGLERDIFQPFVSTKPAGLGLGLSICQSIVDAHGGKLLASNRPVGGASFRVCLPGLCVAAGPAVPSLHGFA